MSNEEIADMFRIARVDEEGEASGLCLFNFECQVKGCSWNVTVGAHGYDHRPGVPLVVRFQALPDLLNHLKEGHKFMRFAMEPMYPQKEG